MRSRQDSAVIFLAFYFQLIQYAAHLFVSSDAGRNQRQAQTVLNHSHHAEHGFHSGRVTVDKQQLEQLRKLVMDATSIMSTPFPLGAVRAAVIICCATCNTCS